MNSTRLSRPRNFTKHDFNKRTRKQLGDYAANLQAAQYGDFADNYNGKAARPRAARVRRFRRMVKYMRRAGAW